MYAWLCTTLSIHIIKFIHSAEGISLNLTPSKVTHSDQKKIMREKLNLKYLAYPDYLSCTRCFCAMELQGGSPTASKYLFVLWQWFHMSPKVALKIGTEFEGGREESQANSEQLPAPLQTLPAVV